MAATPLNSLSFTLSENVTWTGSQLTAGLGGGPTGSGTITNSFTLTKGTNTSSGNADCKFFGVYTVTYSGSTSVTLQNFTDITGYATNSFARIKYLRIWLLGASQYAPDGVTVGTTCTGVTVGGAYANPYPFITTPLTNGTSTASFVINNASQYEYRDGSGTGLALTSTTNTVWLVNNSASSQAIILVEAVGGTS
jgi:hypothetical protein